MPKTETLIQITDPKIELTDSTFIRWKLVLDSDWEF